MYCNTLVCIVEKRSCIAGLYCKRLAGENLYRNTIDCIVLRQGRGCIAIQSLGHDTVLGRGAGRAGHSAGACGGQGPRDRAR